MSYYDTYSPYAQQVAQQYGVPWNVFSWQINQESGWNPNAQNGNATGIGQFMPGTAAQFGIDPTNPYQSLNAAAKYDAQLYQQTGSWQGALTKYGTLANVGQSVLNSFQNALSLGGSSGGNSSSTTAGTIATSDSFITKISMIVLGIVVIGGALFLFGTGKLRGA